MLEKQKKYLLLILTVALLWILGSAYVYTCILKGFCETNKIVVEQEKVQEDTINDDEDSFDLNDNTTYLELNSIDNEGDGEKEVLKVEKLKNFERRTIKCYTHINSVIKLNSSKNILAEVKKLENFFNDYYKQELSVDGIYGEKERQSVMEFQKTKNLDIDGVVGPKTLEIINAVYCVKNENK